MSPWLPRLQIGSWTLCSRDGEAEGYSINFEWLGLVVELAVACRPLPPPREESLDDYAAKQW